MNARQSAYFARQIATPSLGPDSLDKLQSSCVGVAGTGGVGSAVAYYLARSGLGRIKLVDQDIVEPSNLSRMHSVSEKDLFHPKAEAVSRSISNARSLCKVEAVVETITESNVERIFEDVDLIVDGLDNFRTRYIINKFAVKTETPYLFMSAVAEQAHLALLNPTKTACLECLMPSVPDRIIDSCEVLGISPTITGLTGSLGASCAIRFLAGRSTDLSRHLLTVDSAGPDFTLSSLARRENCRACAQLDNDTAQTEPILTFLCGEHTANALPPPNIELKLSKVLGALRMDQELLATESVIVFRRGPFTISVFGNGRLLISGVDNEETASRIVRELRETLGIGELT